MIRYVIVHGKRYVLHSFLQDRAIVEDATGAVSVIGIDGVVFDPPTEELMRQQLEQQARQQAAGSRS